MEFQTYIKIPRASNPVDYNSHILLLGSCFAQNIGVKLKYYQFQTNQNPFGILFHAQAIANLINRAVHKEWYSQEELIHQDGRWHCMDAHSILSHTDKNIVLKNLNQALVETLESLTKASHIIITLGTSWVYRHRNTSKIVANCHKISQSQFAKQLLSVEENTFYLKQLVQRIQKVNPKAEVVVTVSPIRHIKDGLVENMQSKAHLIAAVHVSLSKFKKMYYFPAYELLMDELRDYRFYAEDMIHPSKIAIAYIWEKFSTSWISDSSIPIMKRVASVRSDLLHRPFDIHGEKHQIFVRKLKEKQKELLAIYPFMNFEGTE